MAVVLLLTACRDDEVAELPPTLQERLVGSWGLESLDAVIRVDGEDLTLYLAKMAETYGLSAQEVAVAVLLLESQAVQQLVGLNPVITLSLDQAFEYRQRDEAPVTGTWQLSEDEQQLQLTPQADTAITFAIAAFEEDAMTLVLEQSFATELEVSDFPRHVQAQLTMDWIREGRME